MKIYFGIKFHHDNRNRAWIEDIAAHFHSQGHSFTCVARDIEKWGEMQFDPQVLMKKSFELIEECDLAIIDLTEKGVGLGIEAGYAYSMKIPLAPLS